MSAQKRYWAMKPHEAARRCAASTVPSLIILWMLIPLFLCTISSGDATPTQHDHTDNNNKNQDDSIGAAARTTTTFSSLGTEHVMNNNDPYSLGYQYMEDGIQSSSVGNLADALSSFRKAVEAYQLHLVYDQDDAVAKDQLADALYRLAETSSSMPTADINQSQPYYEQARDLYAKLPGKSAKLRWAHCLARLGVLMIDQHSTHLPKQVQDLMMQQSLHHGDDWNDEEAMEQVMSQIDVNIPNQAIQYFQDAANVFRSSLDVEGSRQMLATSLQNMAVAMTHAGRVNDAIITLEESIGIYEAMVATGLDDDSAQGMAEAFYSLSDLYLQNSNYEMAKDRYRRSSKFDDAAAAIASRYSLL
jgi:tetratricopeptide (TPR) repeat protein